MGFSQTLSSVFPDRKPYELLRLILLPCSPALLLKLDAAYERRLSSASKETLFGLRNLENVLFTSV
ncbi:MAG: hypothetical protein LCI00_23975 [Chloroflexi bacterium]|nr:hypothetical protein [Chloroflexota bacterium]MCC6896116.1 hypothetical protein [Anaerolineae bacterium]